MYILTPSEMAECDKETIENGFPEILLMESAGLSAAEYADEILTSVDDCILQKDKIIISVTAGKGNNGGDGLTAARFLHQWGYEVKVFLAAEEDDLKGVTAKNYSILKNRGVDICKITGSLNDSNALKIKNSDLIIDALLGTGIKGEVRGVYRYLIDVMNESSSPVLSVDIPSGINGKTGEICGRAVKALFTVTMAAYKRGLLLFPGRKYAGKIRVADIGITDNVIKKHTSNLKVLSDREILALLPERKRDGHKGSFGKVLIIGGKMGMEGAAVLSGESCLHTGAGLVYIAVPETAARTCGSLSRELVVISLKSSDNIVDTAALDTIFAAAETADLVVVGPGMGSSKNTQEIMQELITSISKPLIIDADGINSIINPAILKKSRGEILLTPHPGEMARLLGKTAVEINKNRIETAEKFAAEYGVNLILKGASTVISSPDGETYINTTGTDGMATAGSGDVLTGIAAGLAAQQMNLFSSAVLAAYIHGKAGEKAAEKYTEYYMTAGDIIENLSVVWKQLIRKY
ncbi:MULTISPECIES: NAD(P)H-hydrate dehydratase [unclassified Halanaerobium]|uniref:NAD(P)H-hydrate dehydratase n=1 Tax=unclassified Halanaerobium TaxID=2641197 RepID=UPI000DF32698|nr:MULTISPECIES: NAD(P)H-hydrate dehydratase [unclassified Halanaerobium]RCW49272.1 NAD(P)H-hydrate epimerase [Halanaerobium sp. MA284_MarDTE_T2]RCW84011.1 NAD(P)H-hydrate epimerase [Halanaerobium sp. DL-01]